MKKSDQCILILSHCGYSFVEDLAPLIRSMGMRAVVLSSHPVSNVLERFLQLKEAADEVLMVDDNQLIWRDIKRALDYFSKKNIKIIACVSVWEGYRSLMAKVNELLGANDMNAEKVELLRDKFSLRKFFVTSGVSKIDSDLLTKENFKTFKDKVGKKFIKPRFGVASYGAFSLKNETSWTIIESIQNEIRNDCEYKSVFNKDIDFIIEDYIGGKEYSFEIIVSDDKVHLIAVHEKIELHEENLTILESACISPPVNLDEEDINNASLWLGKVFSKLNVRTGCFHVEARKNENNWEIIEINPRVGGSYIVKSCEILTGGANILSLWIETLISFSEDKKRSLNFRLDKISLKKGVLHERKTATYFRVFFCSSAGHIKSIDVQPIANKPDFIKIIAKPGQKIERCSREFFIGQALWSFQNIDNDQKLKIMQDSNNLFEVIYE